MMKGIYPGYVFDPRPEELMQYLSQKINGVYPPSALNRDVFEWDLYGKETPWEIFRKITATTGQETNIFYFFTFITKKNSRAITRATACGGRWKSEKQNPVFDEDESEMIGYKTDLSYRETVNGKSTGWVMHEYSFNQTPKLDRELVLCSITRADNVSPDGPRNRQSNLRGKKRDRTSYETDTAAAASNCSPDPAEHSYYHQYNNDQPSVATAGASNCYADQPHSYYQYNNQTAYPTNQSNLVASTSSYAPNPADASTSSYVDPTYQHNHQPPYPSSAATSTSYEPNSYCPPTCNGDSVYSQFGTNPFEPIMNWEANAFNDPNLSASDTNNAQPQLDQIDWESFVTSDDLDQLSESNPQSQLSPEEIDSFLNALVDAEMSGL
ncbi:hypothetical protein ACHQM5_016649 [Ranunculus cassubicifolius]